MLMQWPSLTILRCPNLIQMIDWINPRIAGDRTECVELMRKRICVISGSYSASKKGADGTSLALLRRRRCFHFWPAVRELSQCRHLSAAAGRVHCLSRLALPGLRHRDQVVRQHSGHQLRDTAPRTMPKLPRPNFADLSFG